MDFLIHELFHLVELCLDLVVHVESGGEVGLELVFLFGDGLELL